MAYRLSENDYAGLYLHVIALLHFSFSRFSDSLCYFSVMLSNLFISFLCFIYNNPLYQAKDITVSYVCKVNNFGDGVKGKTSLKRITTIDGDTTNTETDSVSLEDIFRRISFEQIFTITANADCSFTTFGQNTLEAGFHINMPDTIRYCNGKWISIKQSQKRSINNKEIQFTRTNESKVILGYNCLKFIGWNADENEKYVIWASKDLPATLLPASGFKSFGYGVLEIYETGNKWSIVASAFIDH